VALALEFFYRRVAGLQGERAQIFYRVGVCSFGCHGVLCFAGILVAGTMPEKRWTVQVKSRIGRFVCAQ
jgi:hypothetical protein